MSSPEGATHYIYLGKELIAKLTPNAEHKDKSGYTGHLEDKDIDLTYMQQRYYDPVIGRFYSNDPVGFTASNPMMFNRYAYANNNPYKFTDPDGRHPVIIGIGIGLVFDAAIEAISGEDNSDATTAGNAAIGGAVAATGPFEDKPRGGAAGGGPAGKKTSVASKINHSLAKSGKISTRQRHVVTKVLRKVPYVGTAIAAGQLVSAVNDRANSENKDENKKPETPESKEQPDEKKK